MGPDPAGHRDTRRDDPMRTQGKHARPHTRREASGSLPCPRLHPGLWPAGLGGSACLLGEPQSGVSATVACVDEQWHRIHWEFPTGGGSRPKPWETDVFVPSERNKSHTAELPNSKPIWTKVNIHEKQVHRTGLGWGRAHRIPCPRTTETSPKQP